MLTRDKLFDESASRTLKIYPQFRLIHLPAAVVSMFRVMKLETGGIGPVFNNAKGELVRDNAVRSAFNAGFKALELPWRATHICRHTWGTLGLKANNDNISKVQVNMGHSDRRVSEIYAKAQAQAARTGGDRGIRHSIFYKCSFSLIRF